MSAIQPYSGITLENYADFTDRMWFKFQDPIRSLAVAALGLSGEVGEVQEHIKKFLDRARPVDKSAMQLELGDVLFYLCRVAREFDIDMGDIMRANIAKLEARYP